MALNRSPINISPSKELMFLDDCVILCYAVIPSFCIIAIDKVGDEITRYWIGGEDSLIAYGSISEDSHFIIRPHSMHYQRHAIIV